MKSSSIAVKIAVKNSVHKKGTNKIVLFVLILAAHFLFINIFLSKNDNYSFTTIPKSPESMTAWSRETIRPESSPGKK